MEEKRDPGQMELWVLKDSPDVSISFKKGDKAKERIYGVHKYCHDLFRENGLDPYLLIDEFWTDDGRSVDVMLAKLDADQKRCDELYEGMDYEGQFYKFNKAFENDKWLLEKPTKENERGYYFLKKNYEFLKRITR